MRELYIKNLCIEITRRCNMRCTHCMRGDAESVDIPLKHISNLLRHVRHIHHFNITGGEPSLNVRSPSAISSNGYAPTVLLSMTFIS
ncbi:radical SAM protein [Bacteroides ovatus]|nr:radical SAM protein [Bacteroides ovatus]